jgi:YidC/Oxa1 family membrane protein insertase
MVVFTFSLVMLWENWQKENRPPAPPATAATQGAPAADSVPGGVPGTPGQAPAGASAVPGAATPAAEPTVSANAIEVETDVVKAWIDPVGGNLVRVDLLTQKDPEDPTRPLTLLGPKHRYALQSGFNGAGSPNHNTVLKAAKASYRLADGQDKVEVSLSGVSATGVKTTKTYTFRRGDFLIGLAQEISNGSREALPSQWAYFHLTRDGATPGGETSFGVQTFTGPAVYTDETKYHKIAFGDLDKGKPEIPTDSRTDGWAAMVQHYFVSALVPDEGQERQYYAQQVSPGFYRAGLKLPVAAIAPGASAKVSVPFYAGPQEQSTLKNLAKGLDLVVDYGWLTIFAKPLFWLLQTFHSGVDLFGMHIPGAGNWGMAIILLTILIKAIFFPLSAASYRSMAKMKKVAPRLNKLREQYGDDRMKLNQAMMEMYKTEKINPLGGCLPIVIQIPVFLALYWTLLGAVELRQAPFVGWLHDLSLPDPLYILPALMMISMFLQTKLSPTPPDPVQAKVMMIMPLVFGVMFFWFPSGLVLYWLVNNILSIAQQWQITRMIEGGGDGLAAGRNKAAND